MNKSDLATMLAECYPNLSQKEISKAINVIIDQISSNLEMGTRVEIRGFGSFKINRWKPRFARDPKSGRTWRTKPTNAVYFKAGQELRERVQTKIPVREELSEKLPEELLVE